MWSRFGKARSARYCGPYGWQKNNSTRRYEYPWAYEQVRRLGDGLTIADIGAGLAGLQFTLACAGYDVHAVDPGMRAGGAGWELDAELHAYLARIYRAPVKLHEATLEEAGLRDGSVDVVLSISTIEHFGEGDLHNFAEHARRILRPGGYFVLTVDLFLDLGPFSDAEKNRWGINVNVASLLDALGAELIVGRRDQLYGFPGFDPRAVLGDLANLLIGDSYPALAQCMVARVR